MITELAEMVDNKFEGGVSADVAVVDLIEAFFNAWFFSHGTRKTKQSDALFLIKPPATTKYSYATNPSVQSMSAGWFGMIL